MSRFHKDEKKVKITTEDKSKGETQELDWSVENTDNLSIDMDKNDEMIVVPIKYLFIADCKLSANLLNEMREYGTFKQFSEGLFLNRDGKTLVEKCRVDHLWINLNVVGSIDWIKLHLQGCKQIFTIICVYSKGKKHAKWISDLKEYTTRVIKAKELHKLKTLNQEDMELILNSSINLHKVPSLIAALFSCGKNMDDAKKKP